MDHSKAIEPITALKSRSAELIKRARESGRPIIITQNGRATAVVQDVESYERQRRALQLLRLMATGDRQLAAGEGVEHDEAMSRVRQRLSQLGDG
ncbi:MAG: type II toxin-antitoxin system Phd/YefM family antitoxin [Acidobacteriota bacterium]